VTRIVLVVMLWCWVGSRNVFRCLWLKIDFIPVFLGVVHVDWELIIKGVKDLFIG